KDREGLMKLLSLKGDEADIVVVSELSRLSREDDALNVLNKINDLLNIGFDVVFLDRAEKIYKAHSRLTLIDIITLSVEANLAAEERKKIATRMKTGKYPKIQANPYMYVGGTAPYGFDIIENPEFAGQKDNRPAKSIMVINNAEMDNVRLIYSWILDGMTIRDAAKKANELGFVTRENKPFCQTSIAKIIKNPIYNGRRRFKGFNLATDKIISDTDWNLAQERMQQNRLFKGHGDKHFNPLKGIVFCPCGYGMMLHQMGGKRDSSYITLHCCVRHRPEYGHKCKNGGIKADVLFDAVWKCVKATILEKEYKNKSNDEIKNYERTIKALRNRQNDINKTILKYKADKDIIPDLILQLSSMENASEQLLSTYNNKYVEYDRLIAEQESKLETINQDISTYQDKIKDIRNIAIMQELDNIEETAKADIYKRVLSRVVYYSENQMSGFIVVSFKNGLEAVILTAKLRARFTAQLPFTFKFDKEKRKVLVPTEIKKPNREKFEFVNYEYKEYGVKELRENFNLDDWELK
ncbi:MAG: recombinase family protein, partial [Aeriscardovia sp.]|nr:recombinase family protein [Aeriscardovia sp.]